jgi:nucleoside-diphosphate-sugar epimerase
MNILVTGATGFIGKNLVRKLAQDKANRIICLVRPTSDIDELRFLGVAFLFGDICDKESLEAIDIDFSVDVLFHCAAYVNDRNVKKLNRVNVIGTENIFRFALEHKIKKTIYLSSVAVVSGNTQIPLTEGLPYAATNNYGASKIEAEKIAVKYRIIGLNIAIIRPCMVYGEEEPHVMKYLLKAIIWRLLPIMGTGRFKFHLVYIQHVVDALIFMMNNDRCFTGTFFIADKEILTDKEVLTIMAQALGAKPPIKMPDMLCRFLLWLPVIGAKIKFFQKDRVYSTYGLESLGFKFRFDGRKALADSVRNFKRQNFH